MPQHSGSPTTVDGASRAHGVAKAGEEDNRAIRSSREEEGGRMRGRKEAGEQQHPKERFWRRLRERPRQPKNTATLPSPAGPIEDKAPFRNRARPRAGPSQNVDKRGPLPRLRPPRFGSSSYDLEAEGSVCVHSLRRRRRNSSTTRSSRPERDRPRKARPRAAEPCKAGTTHYRSTTRPALSGYDGAGNRK